MSKCERTNATTVKVHKSCSFIEQFHLNFNGINGHQKDSENKGCIEFCCLSLSPGVALCDSAEDSIMNLIDKRSKIITASKQIELNKKDGNIKVDNAVLSCEKCPYFKEWDKDGDGYIHFININMYPSVCQGKCIYCGVHNSKSNSFNMELHAKLYENMFAAIEWANDKGLIAPDALWQCASGEITIHPYKDKIFEIMKNKNAKFLTNCFVFDEKLSQMLAQNSNACINLSIDAGTAKTWNKIKRIKNFNEVLINLEKYSNNVIKREQVTLKYIIIPGINDNIEEYIATIKIMEKLKLKKIILSRDNRFRVEKMIAAHNIKSNNRENAYSELDVSTAIFAALLKKNGMIADYGIFWPDEYKAYRKIDSLATEFLKTNKI